MKTNKGISLIVLVITIIVMIVLAGAIILSLNNAGIINKANEAVDKTNEATIKQLAEVKWAEAYLNKDVNTDNDYYSAIANGLQSEGIDTSLWNINATSNGVTIEKIENIWYYDSLKLAIEDANNDGKQVTDATTGENKLHTLGEYSNSTKSNAVAGVYTTENGSKYNVVLLNDLTEGNALTSVLKPTRSMTINLNGHKVEFNNCGAAINCAAENATITIDGRIQGSGIRHTGKSSTVRTFGVQSKTGLIVNGGEYISITTKETSGTGFTAACLYILSEGTVELNDAKFTLKVLVENATSTASQSAASPFSTILSYGAQTTINACELNIIAENNTEYPQAVFSAISSRGITTVNNSIININSNAILGEQNGIRVHDGEISLSGSRINVTTTSTTGYSIGVNADQNTKATLTNANIIVNAKFQGIGILNDGESNISNCEITSSHDEIRNYNKLFVDGQEYENILANVFPLLRSSKYDKICG